MIRGLILLILGIYTFSFAQTDTTKIPALEYKTVIPGEEYQAGSIFRIFFGDHWRDLWTTPVTVPVIDLQKYAGGLTPIKTGGGFQTKSLHFKGADGKFYKFRSINKDPAKVLPEDLRASFVSDIVQDQISTSHPMSAVIVAPMLNAVGVLNANPIMVYLPDSPLLGEYRQDYKNLLGTIAENPKDDTAPELIFAGAEKIKSNYKIFEELDKNNKNQVDAPAYLKTRLMDIFLGDWDRHVGQWKWARYERGEQNIWEPIPRDRDQAFSRYDGFFPWIASLAVPQIENFDEDYPQLDDLTWSGRHLDRRFLMSVDKAQWDSVTAFVQNHLTDEVIENAVKRMPDSWFKLEGPNLIETLKKRRDKLPEISLEYYEEISKYISVKTSDKSELAEITRLDDDKVLVKIYDLDKNGHKKKKPFFKRLFGSDYTGEIRIYLQGGDDKAIVKGRVDESIDLKIIGGDGSDELIDSSQVDGYTLYILPIPDAESETEFYDSDEHTRFVKANGTCIDRSWAPEPKQYIEGDNVNEKYEPPVRDWGYDWKPGQWLGYTSDDGFQIGGGPILIKHGFRADPYVWKMSLMYGYATTARSNRLEYKSEFNKWIENWQVLLNLGKNEQAYNRFYGLGNETEIKGNVEDSYYRISQELIYADLIFRHNISSNSAIDLSLQFKNSNLKPRKNTIITSDDFKGTGKHSLLSFDMGWTFDGRDQTLNAKDGLYINARGQYVPAVMNNKEAYTKGVFDTRFYYTPDNFPVTLANRFHAEKVWGNYYLFDAAILGGSDILRGFNRERFAGDAALFFASEVRVPIAKLKVIIPGVLGFSAHAETGRVFYKDTNNSTLWHPAAGGGVWVSYLNDAIMLNITGSQSGEGLQIYFTTGFMF